jgi:anti-sigma B factor antagonist
MFAAWRRSAGRRPPSRVQRRGPSSCYVWTVVVVSGEHYLVLWIGQTALITLPAEIDITNADQVREDLLSVLNQGAVLLIADMSETTFCDSAGVGALARTFRRAEASQSEMRLVVSTRAVHRVLTLTGVDRLLDIYPNVAAAMADRRDSPAQNDDASGGNSAGTVNTDGGAA